MAKQKDVSAPPRERLLIKVILPKQGAEKKVEPGGSLPKPFRAVTHLFRQSLSTRLLALRSNLKAHQLRTAPIRIKLLRQACAKSHRPDFLFSQQTCPIIGGGKLGELFVKATDTGLSTINRLVLESKSPAVIKQISTIETIEPITPDFRLGGLKSEDIIKASPKKDSGFITKIQLFDFGENDQESIRKDFLARCAKAQIMVDKQGYSDGEQYYRAICAGPKEVEQLSNILGVRSIKGMPILRAIRTQEVKPTTIPEGLPQPEDGISNYPVVVVVDSGISPRVPGLGNWILGKQTRIAPEYHNTRHGTFVAGLLCWGRELNQSLDGIDGLPCRVFDLHVMPNDNPQFGPVDELTESELLQDLETALRAHANDFKVWNLSMSTNEVCSLDDFSSFAVELDHLQEKYDVSFVISAGNYTTIPLLDYPRKDQDLEKGRITTPADSLLGITVGAVSHISHSTNGPQKGQPSAFSRHGAGPNYIIKPDLVHFGGSCTRDVNGIHGINSVDETGVVADMGTSFSAPLVSRALANIYHQITPTPSPTLARAILTHHARHPATRHRIPDREENFIGFGLPHSTTECLECPPWASTLVFEDVLRPGYFLEWDDFPYPDSLRRNGRYFGDIWMTVAFAPSRGPRWGTEYCETHIEAHFGVFYRQTSRTSGDQKAKFKGLVPPEHKNPGVLYEAYQVEKLRKWAPVRTYFGSLGNKGHRGDRWRLKVQLLCRHGVQEKLASNPQKFALMVTIADPDRKLPVYNEMAIKIRNRWQFQNIGVRSTVRVQQT